MEEDIEVSDKLLPKEPYKVYEDMDERVERYFIDMPDELLEVIKVIHE